MSKQMMAWIGTAFGVASGVFAWIKFNGPNILKAIRVSADVLDILSEGVDDSQDDKLTPEEVAKLTVLFTRLKQDLKGGWVMKMKSKMKFLGVFLLMFLVSGSVAHADLMGTPKPQHQNTNMKISASADEAIYFPATGILNFVNALSDKAGFKECVGLDRWGVVNYAATTIYTFPDFPVGVNVGAVDTDGVGVTADYNLGSILSSGNDPLSAAFDYAWVGAGGEARQRDGNTWEASWLLEVGFKFAK